MLVDLNRVAALVLEALGLDELLEELDELFLVFLDSSLHAGVPMVLDRVVGSSLKDVGDVSPFVCLVSVQEVENPFFFS